VFSLMFEASQQPDSHIDLRFSGFRIGYRMELNLAEVFGVNTARERALRQMFRELDFRRAITHAIDRDGLAMMAFPGPLTQGWYGGYPSGSPMFDPALVDTEAQRFDPELSREILAGLGFRDTDGDGILNWPDGTEVAGQNLIIEAISPEDQAAAVEVGQALVPLMRDIGIDFRFRVLTPTAFNVREDTANFDVIVSRVDQPTPEIQMGVYGPVTADDPRWHQSGPEERVLLDFEARIEEILQQARFESDAAVLTELMQEALELHIDNLYTIGLYEARDGLAVHTRLRNVPDDLPTYLYEWGMEHMPWIAFTGAEEQIAPRFLDRIPTDEAYQNRTWNR